MVASQPKGAGKSEDVKAPAGVGGQRASEDSPRAGLPGPRSEPEPEAKAKANEHKFVIEVDFKNAYSDAVRGQCVKRYADGILGVYPVSVVDRLDVGQVKKLDEMLMKLRSHWQEPDQEGLVLKAGKSRDFFKLYSDEFLPFLGHSLFIDKITNEGASPNGGHVEARFSMDEWGRCEAGPIMVEITNYYPWYRKDGEYQYWCNGFHAVSICQFLEFCRYRGYLSFERLEWLKR